MFNAVFRKNTVSKNCLKVLIEKCLKFLDKGGFSGLPMIDLSKTFDCNNHELLIEYGFDIKSLEFIDSLIAERKNRVKINLSFKEWGVVHYGVLQGSILGLLLFIIHTHICITSFCYTQVITSRKFQMKINVATKEGNSPNEIGQ